MCTSSGAPSETPPVGIVASLSPTLALLALGSPNQDPGERLTVAQLLGGWGGRAACGLSAAYASGSCQCLRVVSVNDLYFLERHLGYGTLGGEDRVPTQAPPSLPSWPLV